VVGRRAVKNPSRVPALSQFADPVGRQGPPGIGVLVSPIGGTPTMPTIDKTGTYRDGDGNTFFYREGHPVEQWQKDDLEMVDEGLPLTENEEKAAKRAEDLARKREGRADAGPTENRMEPAPENRAAGDEPAVGVGVRRPARA
jgi:hypothetical protein